MWQPNRLEEERLEKARRLEAAGIELYPRRVTRTHTAAAALAARQAAEAAAGTTEPPETLVTVAGRIRRASIKGKVAFMHIEDETGRIQLFFRINDLDETRYGFIKDKLIEVDDFVQATGALMRTTAGEISVRVTDFTLLAKSLSPLPVIKQQVQEDGRVVEYGEFSDKETRYRQRYADLAVNKNVRDTFIVRSRVLKAMREFLDDEGMLEVETPILQPLYGGAAARPFTTFHNQLEQELYLRISFELYLKRLLVGGYDAVYEIGRDFRNEGVSFKHNPEFTMMEFYKAYIDYHGVMDIVERMMAHIAGRVLGSTQVTYGDHTIDLTPPWQRLTIREAVLARTGIDYMATPDAESLAALLEERFGQRVKPGTPWGKMVVDELFGTHVEPHLIQPTFICEYPRDVSPFAKRAERDDRHTERFEVFIAGMEFGNAFTELNDPRDQEARFVEMAALYRTGDDDETPLDEDYLRAMRYGMPPCGGFGIGVDRVVMLLTNRHIIRDVLLYPHLRREDGSA
ncbi:MAG: lysine--tRNA ligase [Anaerolineae bacterium]|jgi:lysyl-tRNA synthetase class 2|nr:lysine--tRNA ligase [Anaerolineae bacterium]